MNDNNAYGRSLRASEADHAAREGQTLAERQFGLDGRARYEAIAKQNGMSPDAAAAASYIRAIAGYLSAEAKAVLADREKALPALERVAAVDVSTEGPAAVNAINAAIINA